jgi:hypothetical protein
VNRRDFFKVLSAAGLAVAIPAVALGSTGTVTPTPNPLLSGQIGRYEGFKVIRMTPLLMDFDHRIGLAVQMTRGEDRWRHAVSLPTAAWKEFTAEQREEVWQLVEHKTYEFAVQKRRLT